MDDFIVVTVIEHTVSDAVFIDKLGDFLLLEDKFNEFLELRLAFGSYVVQVDQQELSL